MKNHYYCTQCQRDFMWTRFRYWWSRGFHKKKLCGPIIRWRTSGYFP